MHSSSLLLRARIKDPRYTALRHKCPHTQAAMHMLSTSMSLTWHTWSTDCGWSLWNSLNSEKSSSRASFVRSSSSAEMCRKAGRPAPPHLLPQRSRDFVHVFRSHIILHHTAVALLLDTVSQHLQHEAQTAVHCLQVGLDEDGGQRVSLQWLLHEKAQLVFLFSQQLQTQVSRLLHSVEMQRSSSHYRAWPHDKPCTPEMKMASHCCFFL